MEHNLSLITTIASGFSLALFFGFIAEKLKLQALVGYLLAGVMIGPATPGFVADSNIAAQLSEIGVMLLMFGVGLHFSLEDLLAVKKLAIPGALIHMLLAMLMGAGAAYYAWDWSLETSLFFGLSLSCASTIVLIKALEARHLLDTMNGRIAIGWLIVEDLATILILVLLPPLNRLLQAPTDQSAEHIFHILLGTVFEIVGFMALMLIVARRLLPWLLGHVARLGSRELFTLAVITAAIGIAYGAALLFNVSFALGAFFAGIVLNESEFSHRAAEDSLPLRDAFAVLFFVSVGMLFDPTILIDSPLRVLVVVAIITLGKALTAFGYILLFRYPFNTALTVSVSLGQIGEFSFILGGMGISLGLLPPQGMSLILAGAVLSIALNPLLFAALTPFKKWALGKSRLARRFDTRADPLAKLPKATDSAYRKGHIVLIGYGGVGKRIAETLLRKNIPFVVVDENRERIEALRDRGVPSISGNAMEPSVLAKAYIADANFLIIATPDPMEMRRIAENARQTNKDIEIILRSYSDDDLNYLQQENIGQVFCAKEKLAEGMAAYITKRYA